MIITANWYFSLTPPLFIKTWEEWLVKIVSLEMIRRGLHAPTEITEEEPVTAQVRQGAWMVLCPGPKCKGAELAWEEGLFLCLSCFNVAIGHRLRRSSFPAERRAIETILEPRPLPNRNWSLGETLADLERENVEHGVAVRSI